MIFTDKFVYVHEPKTGGTFVTSMLFRLYGLNWTKLTHLKNIIFKEVRSQHPKYGQLVHNTNKHGGCREIPAHQRDKKVLATIRNPYDLYVSQYEFGWWKRREFLPYVRAVPNFEKDYPGFPDINFADYVSLTNAAFGSCGETTAGQSWGLRTREFVDFYFREPDRAWDQLKHDADYLAADKYRSDMFDVHFVRTNELNRGLYDFLVAMGYDGKDVSFVINQEKILPRGKGRSTEQKWQKYYTPELKQQVREKEHLLFTLFPEFDC